ncbi:MAG: NrsF family protein [Bacteroidales bacterium]
METDHLIEALAAEGTPVHRLASPSRRLLSWLALALPAAAMIVMMMGLRPDIAIRLAEPRFLTQEAAAIATALTAASAAFYAGIPGTPRWRLFLPLLPFALWSASLGQQCWQEWLSSGSSGMEFQFDAECIPGIVMVGLIPALVILAMIRRGAPFQPRLTITLGTLAAAALGDAALRLFHPIDAGLMVLVWQLGTVTLLSLISGLVGCGLMPRL